jgi:hypothetical protein
MAQLTSTAIPDEVLALLIQASVRADLRMGRVLRHLSITDVSDDDVDAALDEQ